MSDEINRLKLRGRIIASYKRYKDSKGVPDKFNLEDLNLLELAGYFLEVHSLNPIKSIRTYYSEFLITQKVYYEVRTIVSLLNNPCKEINYADNNRHLYTKNSTTKVD